MAETEKDWPILTFSEVQQHSSPDDLWMIVFGKVYDTTELLLVHPGGAEVLLDCAGVDATEAFVDVGHSQDAIDMLVPYQVGVIEGAANKYNSPTVTPGAAKKLKMSRKSSTWKFKKKYVSSLKAEKDKTRISVIFFSVLAIVAFALILLLQRQQWVKITS